MKYLFEVRLNYAEDHLEILYQTESVILACAHYLEKIDFYKADPGCDAESLELCLWDEEEEEILEILEEASFK